MLADKRGSQSSDGQVNGGSGRKVLVNNKRTGGEEKKARKREKEGRQFSRKKEKIG